MSGEPLRQRWRRRVVTIPAMLGATAVGIVGAPLLLPLCAVADLVRLRFRLPTARMYLFLLQYGVNDSVEVLLAPVFWVQAGFGLRLRGEASIRRHERVQQWSGEVLGRRAEQLLGLRYELEPGSAEAIAPGRAILLCRHVHLFDASLPGLLAQRNGIRIRGVAMEELLTDPGFDLFYVRTGSVFIQRDDGPAARAACVALGRSLTDGALGLIFPEGRLFRPERLVRSLERLAESDPDRAERLAGLRHVLPPRPGGTLALLDAAPDADVVVLAHAGFEAFPTLGALARAVPVRAPIRVAAWRIPRSAIPSDPAAQVVWLDDLWCELDACVAALGAATHPVLAGVPSSQS